MFNKKFFIILLGLCGVLFAALFFNSDENRYKTKYSNKLFLPELKKQLNELANIRIESVGESVVLENLNDSWVVVSKQNYPADANTIRQLIYAIADLKIVEVKTNDEALLSKIGLTRDAEDAVRIWMTDVKGKTITDIVFGKSQAALSGEGLDWFVRQFEDSQSWLVNGDLQLNRNAYQWLDKTLLTLDTNEIQEVVLNANTDDSLVIQYSDEGQSFELKGIKDEEEVEDYKLDDIVESASSIQLDDVRLKSAEQAGNIEATVQLKTKNGLLVSIFVIDTEQGWISLQARSEADDQAVSDQSQALNNNWSQWEYQIPGYKLDTLLQKKQDITLQKESS